MRTDNEYKFSVVSRQCQPLDAEMKKLLGVDEAANESRMTEANFSVPLNGKALVKCPHCKEPFDYAKQPEIGMGSVACPNCKRSVFQGQRDVDTNNYTPLLPKTYPPYAAVNEGWLAANINVNHDEQGRFAKSDYVGVVDAYGAVHAEPVNNAMTDGHDETMKESFNRFRYISKAGKKTGFPKHLKFPSGAIVWTDEPDRESAFKAEDYLARRGNNVVGHYSLHTGQSFTPKNAVNITNEEAGHVFHGNQWTMAAFAASDEAYKFGPPNTLSPADDLAAGEAHTKAAELHELAAEHAAGVTSHNGGEVQITHENMAKAHRLVAARFFARADSPAVNELSPLIKEVHGLKIVVEQAAGSERTGACGGQPYSNFIPCDYGYIAGADGGAVRTGADYDNVDALLGTQPNDTVYVVDMSHKDGSFDEHKCCIDFADKAGALDAFSKIYEWNGGEQRAMAVTEMTMDEFKQWLQTAQTKVQATKFEKMFGNEPLAVADHRAAVRNWLNTLPATCAAEALLLLLANDFNPDEARDERGRWTKDAMGYIGEKIASYAKAHPQGFSINPTTLGVPKTGFMVSPSKQTEFIVPDAAHLTPDVMKKYLAHWRDALENHKGEAFVGGWKRDDGAFVMDVSVRTNNETEALKLARDGQQDAYFDLKEKNVITTKTKFDGLDDAARRELGSIRGKSYPELFKPEAEQQRFAKSFKWGKGGSADAGRTKSVGAGAGDYGSGTSAETVKLTHFSRVPLDGKMIDPKFYGTGITGAERARAAAFPEHFVPRSYHYVGDKVEPETGLGPHKYELKIPKTAFYDMAADPLKLRDKAVKTIARQYGVASPMAVTNLTEKLAKKSGYIGYMSPSLGGSAAVFHKLPTHGDIHWPNKVSANEYDPMELRDAEGRWLAQTDTPAFKKWFGQSKVVDEDGKPLAVFHGTNASFDKFNVREKSPFEGSMPDVELGTIFTTNKPDFADSVSMFAADFKGGDRSTLPLYMRLEKPLMSDQPAPESSADVSPNDSQEVWVKDQILKAKRDGNDGCVLSMLYNEGEWGKSKEKWYIAFDAKQVKSAIGNNGKFSTRTAVLTNEAPAGNNFKAAKLTILRGAALTAFGNWLEAQLQPEMAKLKHELVRLLETGLTGDNLLSKTDTAIASAFTDLTTLFIKKLNSAADTVQDMGKDILAVHGLKPGTVKPYDTKELLVAGTTIPDTLMKLAADTSFKFNALVRQAEANGDSLADVVKKVLGPTDADAANEIFNHLLFANLGPVEVSVSFLDGALDSLGKTISVAVQSLAQAIDDGLFDELDDDEEKVLNWMWVAVLDDRVCDHCEFYDGAIYDEHYDPVGDSPEMDSPPPLHPNCRCQLVMVDPDEAPLPKNTKMDDFVGQTTPEVREAVFGKAAAGAYDSGDISAKSMLRSSAGGHELSDDSLKEIRQIWDETD